MLKFDFYNKTRTLITEKIFCKLLPAAEKVLKLKNHTFNFELTLVGMKTIQKINFAYRKKNKPTDVISLSYFDKNSKNGFIGEIFICVPFAHKQAKELNCGFEDELKFLFIHGLLHLFGYDHQTPRQNAVMQKLAEEILDKAR